ncbi:MAG: RidA family protein [Gammaproteobacteria bacterium]|nr:RidA family protein [Gammaproteobacteria bacterium]
MSKETIHTNKAPQAIGTYSQAVKHQGLVFISGQIPLDPESMEIVEGGIESRIRRVFENLSAICNAAGGSLDDIVKLTVFLTDLGNFPQVNTIMGQYFSAPYPARAAVEVSALPKGVDVEMDAILSVV